MISVFVPGLSGLYMYFEVCADRLESGDGTLWSPDAGYFMYDPRAMSGQRSDEMAIPGNLCVFF